MRDAFLQLHVRTLCRELDIDTRYMTTDHVSYFEAAGIDPVPEVGRRFDEVLHRLNTAQLRELARALIHLDAVTS